MNMPTSAVVLREVSVRPMAAQRGRTSIPRESSIRPWRCNLAGLSQNFNIFFLACGAGIHVYSLESPYQTLGQEPLCRLQPPKSRAGLQGYIDPLNPHSITNLLVDFLGDDEILIMACDDGDVIAYYVHDVDSYLNRLNLPSWVQNEGEQEQPKPFFIRNVSMSAWGLAVHREARMIAVSANTRRVVVYALALSGDLKYPLERSQEVRIALPQVNNNIPCVSFCQDDPTGRWIIFGDISGFYYICDVFSRRIVSSNCIRFCTSKDAQNCTCLDDDAAFRHGHAVWCTFFLDQRAFREAGHLGQASRVDWQRSDIPGPVTTTTTKDGSWTLDNSLDPDALAGAPPSLVLDEDDHSDAEMHLTDSDSDPEEEFFMESYTVPPLRASGPKQICQTNPTRESSIPSPIMIITSSDILLTQHLHTHSSSTPSPTATIGTHDPLARPSDPSRLHPYLNEQHDRMNMSLQIPSLGLVILASPKGRAAILTLTSVPNAPGTVYPAAGRTLFAFRVEHVLPTEDQEAGCTWREVGGLKAVPLVGVAASPIPGHAGRRWRLLMVYMDHTVFTYELARAVGGSGLGLDDLVV